MRQQTKQRHYISSKDLYFLPNISRLKPSQTKKRMQQASHTSVQKIRSIQQIMLNKSIVDFGSQNSLLEAEKSKKSNFSNLYDKYDYFPNIFALKNGKKNQSDKSKTEGCGQQTGQSMPIHKQKHPQYENQQLEDKENNFNFQSSYYRRDFNRKLQHEIDKIEFAIKYSFSHKNMIIAGEIINDQQNFKERQPIKKKYTKIQTRIKQSNKDLIELQKVPSFLLKCIQTKRQ